MSIMSLCGSCRLVEITGLNVCFRAKTRISKKPQKKKIVKSRQHAKLKLCNLAKNSIISSKLNVDD